MELLKRIGVGIILAFLGAVIAYELYELAIDIGWTLIYSERFRPKSWNSQTIAGVARFAILVLGPAYVMYFATIERTLQVWNERGNFMEAARKRIFQLCAICLILGAILLVINYAP